MMSDQRLKVGAASVGMISNEIWVDLRLTFGYRK